MMELRKLLLLVFCFASMSGVTAQDGWRSLPKGDLFDVASEARVYDGKLFVATDKGIFSCLLQEGENAWECFRYSGMDIIDFAKCGEQFLAVSRKRTEEGEMHQSLLVSSAGSTTPTDITPDDAIRNDKMYGIRIWQLDDNRPEHLFLTYCNSKMIGKSCNMLETGDFAQSWTMTGSRDWYAAYRGSFVAEPSNPNNVLVFGSNPLADCLCPYVLETKDGFQTLESLNFTPSSSFLFGAIAICPTDNNQLLAGTSEGIAKSADHGVHWTIKRYDNSDDDDLWESYRYDIGCHFVAFDLFQPSVAYATFCRKVDKNYYIDVYRSVDGGDSWKILSTSPALSSVMKSAILSGSQLILVSSKGEVACFDLKVATSLPPLSSPADSGLSDTYTLTGAKANGSPRKGVYIENGQKRVVK